MMRRLKNKQICQKGETLMEVLVSIAIMSVALGTLMACIASAHKANSYLKDMDSEFITSLKNAESAFFEPWKPGGGSWFSSSAGPRPDPGVSISAGISASPPVKLTVKDYRASSLPVSADDAIQPFSKADFEYSCAVDVSVYGNGSLMSFRYNGKSDAVVMKKRVGD